MDAFSALFGIARSEIAPTCVLLPFARKNILGWLGVSALARGKLYRTGRGKGFTVVHTGTGAPFLGDAVLYLAEAGARNFILFSACGLLETARGLALGSIVCPRLCYPRESFSRMIGDDAEEWEAVSPDPELFRLLLSFPGAREVTAASVGSLKLVEEKPEMLRGRGIETVDFECAALFSAARKTKNRAGALLYVTDIPGVHPHYRFWSAAERDALFNRIRIAAEWLKTLIAENLSA